MKWSLLYFLLLASTVSSAQTYTEQYRPQFHFSPEINWTNDPNGLVYENGVYHLFFQYNPYGNRWGHMSWGHATSTDLVRWKQLPVAIPEGNKTMIFSGSAVIDKTNSSGFGTAGNAQPMIAVYTGHFIQDSTVPDNYLQSQQIAYSLDHGVSFTKFDGNPVLDLHKKDFRDPKAFWYAAQKKWVMAVVLPKDHIVQLYSSPNLKEWTHMSDFGPAGDTNDIWECSDLLEIPVFNEPGKTKWVIFNSQQVTMQYFVGDFDGTKFISQNPSSKIFRPDYGPDYYAGITYNNLPTGHQPVLVGWANNWSYANDIPTSPWKSAMALPRRLVLKKEGNEYILLQQPVSAMVSLRKSPWRLQNLNVKSVYSLPLESQQCEMVFTMRPDKSSNAGVQLAAGEGNPFVIGYDAAKQILYMDRTGAGDQNFNAKYPGLAHYEVALSPIQGKIKLHVFFDNSIVEVFANDGRAVMTAQVFPSPKNNHINFFSSNGSTEFSAVTVWKMASIWTK